MKASEILNLVVALVISGFFTSVAVNFLKACQWKDWLKVVLTVVISGAVGVAQAYVAGRFGALPPWGELTADNVISLGGVILAGALFWYKTWLKDAPWMQVLERALWPTNKEACK